jgi:aminoglycoside phosphotransferase (APT) family kinase protein
MILTTRTVVYYLLERGLLTPASVVDGDLLVVATNSRNRNFKIIRQQHPSYFVKQVQQWDSQSIGLLQREATCYWRATHDPDFAPLAALAPHYHLYDPARHTLVIDLVQGENLSQYHRRLGIFPLQVAAQLGERMGCYHREIQTAPAKVTDGPAVFPKEVPWILSAHRLGQSPLETLGNANQQILAVIQRYADFHRYLDQLRSRWQFDFFIHGDMKWDNCVVFRENSQEEIKFVDWETADFGDAAWDVGAIFQSYLAFWIMSIPAIPGEVFHLATYPIEAMQPALRAFWQAYVAARELTGEVRQETLIRSMGYGAARMLQTAYEHMFYSPQLTVNALRQLQVSLNILSDPEAAIRELLNIE